MKRHVFIFGLAMLLSVASAFAQDCDHSGQTGMLDWCLKDGTLTISGNGTMQDYNSGGDAPWYDFRQSILNLSIESGVKRIGSYAFYGCNNLSSVTIPNEVLSIGSSAFQNCSGLQSLTIGVGVVSIESYAFRYCSGLTTVNFNAMNCTSMGSSSSPVFGGCTASATLNIGNNVQQIPNYAFYTFSGLTLLTIGTSVSLIKSYAFYNCSNLSAVNFPSTVSMIGDYAFYGSSSLSAVNIPNGVQSIGSYAFQNCSGLQSLTIGSGVGSIGNYAFRYCSGLATVNFNAANCTMGGASYPVFEGCTASATLYIGNTVQKIPDYAFYAFSGLISLSIGTLVNEIGNYAFYNCSNLSPVTIPNGVNSIGNYAFYGCSGSTSLTIGTSVHSIGNYAFYGCSGSALLTIGSAVNSIGSYAFYGCSSLSNVTIPDAVNSIGESAFQNCSGLTSLIIGSGVHSIGNYAFRYCSGLITVNFNAENCTTMGSSSSPVFGGCTTSATLNIGNNVQKIPNNAFYTFSGLTLLTIGTAVTSIGSYAFYNCSNLSSVIIPDAVTLIGNSAFYGCSSLSSVTILNGVKTIESSAFYNCSGLTSLTMGTEVISIGNSAFWNCSSLTSITSFPTVPPTIYGNTFYNVPKFIPVYIPCNTLNAYQSANYWGDFTNYQTMGSPPSQPGNITGATTVCSGGGAQTYSISAVPNATSYTWTLPIGWTGNSTTTSISATPGSNAQSNNIIVVAHNSCGNSPASTLAVTVNFPPTMPTNISGPKTVCAGGGAQDYSIFAVPDATSYTWTLPDGWSGSSTTTSISAIPGSDAQSDDITVVANNDYCSSPKRTLAVTVNYSPPTAPTAIYGSTTVCAGGGEQGYTIYAVPGATSYTWTLPNGWNGSSTSNFIYATPGSNAQSGDITVVANNDCGSSSEQTLAVTVNTPPTAPTGINGTTIIEIGQSTTLTASGGDEGSGCTYQWGMMESCGDRIISGQTGISITVKPTTTTPFWVRRIGASPCNDTTECATITVTVNVGIDEISGANINIYPNPVKDVLTITNYELGITDVKIYDMLGREVLESRLLDGKVDVSQLSSGTYVLRLGGYAVKFVKE